jgi:hypothetical protein
MKLTGWDIAKNEELKAEGRPSFEEVQAAIDAGGLVDKLENENYPGQQILAVRIDGYMHAVPVEPRGETEGRPVTVWPSRALQKKYGG